MYSSAEEISASTVSAMTTVTGHHMLKIEGYSILDMLHATGSAFKSCEFEAAGHTWKIAFFPNGELKEDESFVSVFLELAGATAESVVHAEFEFSLVYPRGTLVPWPSHRVTSVATFSQDITWGLPTFIGKEALATSRFFKDDCLAIRCRITVIETSVVKDEVVQAPDLERMGMVRTDDDDTCKRLAVSNAEDTGEELKMAFVRFCEFICGG